MMTRSTGLFGQVKTCEFCGRELPENYKENLCPNCIEHKLFQDVKEYIRANDVNEFDVATHFHIPLSRVKQWIREGRIEYKENSIQPVIKNLHCQKCGAPINFGVYCTKCLKKMNTKEITYAMPKSSNNAEHMRYLDSDDSSKNK